MDPRKGTKWKDQLRNACRDDGILIKDVKAKAAELRDTLGITDRDAMIVAHQAIKAVDTPKVWVIQYDQNPERADRVGSRNLDLAPCVTPCGRYVKVAAEMKI